MSTIFTIMLGWNVIGLLVFAIIYQMIYGILIEDMIAPWGVYKHMNVNWFGAIVLTLVFNLLCPVLSIGWWFYWLCTVGRK